MILHVQLRNKAHHLSTKSMTQLAHGLSSIIKGEEIHIREFSFQKCLRDTSHETRVIQVCQVFKSTLQITLHVVISHQNVLEVVWFTKFLENCSF